MKGAEGFESRRCKIGVAFSQGITCNMQDRYSIELDKQFVTPEPVDYTAVIGGVGHDGDTASLFVASNLNGMVREQLMKGKSFLRAVEDACTELDERLMTAANTFDGNGQIFRESGATLCALWLQSGKIFCANVGDCRVIVSHNNSALPITKDHVPDDPVERGRIEHAGCKVCCNKIDGRMNVSRAFGLYNYKQFPCAKLQQVIISLPSVYEVDMDPRINFFILASGSVWECVSNQQAVTFVENHLRDRIPLQETAKGLVDWCETLWRNCNAPHGGTGNLTCIILTLDPCAFHTPAVGCSHCPPAHIQCDNTRVSRLTNSTCVSPGPHHIPGNRFTGTGGASPSISRKL